MSRRRLYSAIDRPDGKRGRERGRPRRCRRFPASASRTRGSGRDRRQHRSLRRGRLDGRSGGRWRERRHGRRARARTRRNDRVWLHDRGCTGRDRHHSCHAAGRACGPAPAIPPSSVRLRAERRRSPGGGGDRVRFSGRRMRGVREGRRQCWHCRRRRYRGCRQRRRERRRRFWRHRRRRRPRHRDCGYRRWRTRRQHRSIGRGRGRGRTRRRHGRLGCGRRRRSVRRERSGRRRLERMRPVFECGLHRRHEMHRASDARHLLARVRQQSRKDGGSNLHADRIRPDADGRRLRRRSRLHSPAGRDHADVPPVLYDERRHPRLPGVDDVQPPYYQPARHLVLPPHHVLHAPATDRMPDRSGVLPRLDRLDLRTRRSGDPGQRLHGGE